MGAERLFPPGRTPTDVPRWIGTSLIFGATLASRIALLGLAPAPGRWPVEPDFVVRSLLESGQFANPFILPTGPTAHLAPLHPGLVTAYAMACGGAETCGVRISQYVACLCAALVASMLPMLAERIGLSWRVGAVGALVGLLPQFPYRELDGAWEAPLSQLVLVGLACMTARPQTTSGAGRRGAAIGALTGVGVLISPTLAVPAAGLGVLWLAKGTWPGGWRARGRGAGGALLVAALIIAPWIVRCRVELGSWMFIRDNFGLELAVSNNDRAGPTFVANSVSGANARHPFVSPVEARRVAEVGEVAYNRERMAEAKAWIMANPRRFAGLTSRRVFTYWFELRDSRIQVPLGILVSVLGLLGVAAAAIRLRGGAGPLLVPALLFPLPYYLVQTDVRYRLPVQWVLEVGAGLTLCLIVDAVRRRRPGAPVGA